MASLGKESTGFSTVVSDTGGGDLNSDPYASDPTATAVAALTALQRSGGGDRAKAAFLIQMKTAIDKLISSHTTPLGVMDKRLGAPNCSPSSTETELFDSYIDLATDSGKADFSSLAQLPPEWAAVDISMNDVEAIIRLFDTKEKAYRFALALNIPKHVAADTSFHGLCPKDHPHRGTSKDHGKQGENEPQLKTQRTWQHGVRKDGGEIISTSHPLRKLKPNSNLQASLVDKTYGVNNRHFDPGFGFDTMLNTYTESTLSNNPNQKEATRIADKLDYLIICLVIIFRLIISPYTIYSWLVTFVTVRLLYFCQNWTQLLSMASISFFNSEVKHLCWFKNAIYCIILQLLYILYTLIKLLQLPLQIVNTIWKALAFWPKLFWHLYGPQSKGRSILDILRDPANSTEKPFSTRRLGREADRKAMTHGHHLSLFGNTYGVVSAQPIHATLNVFTSYQVNGQNSYLCTANRDALIALQATRTSQILPFRDDPLCLDVIYRFFARRIDEPPDCLWDRIWIFFWSLVNMFWIIGIGWTNLLFRLACKRFFASAPKEKHKAKRRRKGKRRVSNRRKAQVEFSVFVSATNNSASSQNFSWDSDGIPFIVDTGANIIISNVKELFVSDLTPTEANVQTHSGDDIRRRFRGTFRLVLPDDHGKEWEYLIPDCVYDPKAQYNILGVAKLANYFNDSRAGGDLTDFDCGTFAQTSATRTLIQWDNGKHQLHFWHDTASQLPEIRLYPGISYFQAFCTRVSRLYDSTISHAFASAYTVAPEPPKLHIIPDDEGEVNTDKDDSDDIDDVKWYNPSGADFCQPCNPKDSSGTQAAAQPSTSTSTSTPTYQFKLGSNLLHTYRDKKTVKRESVVYEGVNADGLTHIVRRKDGSKITVHDSDIVHELQPSFTNLPDSPLAYKKEVGIGITDTEAQELARPRTLTPIQQELLSWHHRLYHLSLARIIRLAKLGILPKSLLQCENNLPKCVACQFGAAHRRPWRTKGKKHGSIQKQKEKLPGDGVSADQIVSAQPGLVPQMSGFLTSDRLWGATTFVDHVSDYVYVHLMKNFTIEDTLLAKKAFERIFTLAGREVKSYRLDNGRFADTQWQEHCNMLNQSYTYCGVGHHAQNGKIEAKNKFLTTAARTLLLHGMRHWPEMISTFFWPFAMKAAAEMHNKLHLDADGRTPESKLYGIPVEDIPVKSYHTLFCPVFVLDHRAHTAGSSPPKWEPRSRCGVYIGHSPLHAGSVALVFNPLTGRVSPAYHVVFDDDFSTVPYMKAATVPPNWEDLVRNSSENATDGDYDLADTWFKKMGDDTPQPLSREGSANRDTASVSASRGTALTDPFSVVPDQRSNVNQTPSMSPPPAELPVPNSEGDRSVTFAEGTKPAASTPKRIKLNDGSKAAGNMPTPPATPAPPKPNELEMPKPINLAEAGLRRSARIAERNARVPSANYTRFGIVKKAITLYTALSTVCQVSIPDSKHSGNHFHPTNTPTFTNRMMTKFHEANELYDGTLNSLHHFSFVTQDVSSNEVFTYHQAMKQTDKADFQRAMVKEVKDHEERGHWEIVTRSSMPEGMTAIKSIWSFKRKRLPDGTLLKHKARLCAHGGMQRWGENYWETYSPVVNMMTVRLLLLICKIHKLHSKSIDFVLAFPQAELEEDIWMELPIGFEVEIPEGQGRVQPYVLKLKRNLYGLKQGSHNWYEHLKAGLKARGLTPHSTDPCLYLKKGLAVLTYVDDCIIISTEQETIDDFVESMMNGPEKFILTDEGDIDKFLGIEINHNDDGSFEICQPHLIDRILKLLQLDGNNEWGQAAKTKLTPSEKVILHKDRDGEPRKRSWKYRTAVGMLTYLQGNSRPDISVAVHQCARFSIDPKRSHECAVIRLGRYLSATRERGLIYKPDTSKGLECYVDADFAGGWKHADAQSADSVMSRTGYIIMYANCPIHWVSKLQTEIALSTAEAEYIAMSQALREVIPMMDMMKDLKEAFPMEITIPNFNCTVHEDNQSCISMATKQKFSPRTKHIALKYHHFRSFVNSKRINVKYINTHDQLADALTKPLDPETFYKLRKLLCGW